MAQSCDMCESFMVGTLFTLFKSPATYAVHLQSASSSKRTWSFAHAHEAFQTWRVLVMLRARTQEPATVSTAKGAGQGEPRPNQERSLRAALECAKVPESPIHGRVGSSVCFPQVLYEMLFFLEMEYSVDAAAAIGWQPHGRCFLIRDKAAFVQRIMPR
jgi:hypothetical protein